MTQVTDIGTSVEGSYYFNCSIEGIKNFIKFDDQFVFVVNEYAGNIMPDFEMFFVSSEDKLMAMLHEGTVINASIGRTRDEVIDMTLYVASWDSTKYSENHRAYSISGFASPIDYACNPSFNVYSKKSAIDAVLESAKRHFKKIESDVLSSDIMTWIQPNLTDREFIQKTLYRADMGDSFPACAISLDGRFILKDMKKTASADYDWKLVRGDTKDKKEVAYFGDPVVSSNTGIVNKMLGYGFDFKSMFIDAETFVNEKIESKKLLASSNKVGGLKNVEPKVVMGLQRTENMHENYHRAYYHNITQLLNASRVEIHVTVPNYFYKFRPLDTFMMTEASLENSNVTAEYHSGRYFTTFVSRTIQNRQLTTTLKLNRESLNQVK